MPATTTNIAVTFATAKTQDLIYASAAATDKILLLVFNGSSVILSKKSVNYGGSADEIAITVDTKLTAKFTAADASIIPDQATYKCYLVSADSTTMEEIFNGTFTVTGTTVIAGTLTPGISMLQVAEVFDSNADSAYTFPENCVLHGVLIKATGGSPVIDLVDADSAVVLNDAQTVQDVWTYFEVNKFLHAGTSDKVSITSADYESSELNIVFIFYTVEI